MTPHKPKNVAASVQGRLRNISREQGEDFQRILARYGVERFLDRLSKSEYAGRFVLKGAVLFAIWTGKPHRPTRDLDLLGSGPSGREDLREVFRSICAVAVEDDGLEILTETMEVKPIREGEAYEGQRVTLKTLLGKTRINLQIDVGFGDAITPGAVDVDFPTLLGTERPRLRAYTPETVVAEKLEAFVKLGMKNSRMKDFFDVVWLARAFEFPGDVLKDAIIATFTRRRTTLPTEPPVAFTKVFADDPGKISLWKIFVDRNGLADVSGELGSVVLEIARFLTPPLMAAAKNEAFVEVWKPSDGWQAH